MEEGSGFRVQHYAVNHSGGYAVILNGVKDLTQAE
jgi:hypothetical protein